MKYSQDMRVTRNVIKSPINKSQETAAAEILKIYGKSCRRSLEIVPILTNFSQGLGWHWRLRSLMGRKMLATI